MQITFVCLIYPVLILTYAGQTAFISKNLGTDDVFHLRESIPNSKFSLLLFSSMMVSSRVNSWFLFLEHMGFSEALQHVFTVLSLFASAVGSQATITAGFSIINQCQALDCFPRVEVVHTSENVRGQVYVPDANWVFMALSLAVTIGFHDISSIGKATGTYHSRMFVV